MDPDYDVARPTAAAGFIAATFPQAKPLRMLDYGGGNGRMAELLRQTGFTDVTTYDPFVPARAAPPDGRFDLVLCIEVVEHAPRRGKSSAR